MRSRHALIAAAVALAIAAPAMAKKDKNWGPPAHVAEVKVKPHKELKPHKEKKERAAPRFAAGDAVQLRGYFEGKPVSWTMLPPGIAKNVARGKPLPPGIAKKLPQDALANLPQHEGYEYAQVGRDVVLIETASRIVVDIIERIFD